MGYQITNRAIRQRQKRLERDNIILGYSVIVNPAFVSEKVNRTFIIKFKLPNNFEELIHRLKKYTQEAPYCVYSARLSGDFDWIIHYVFDSTEQYKLESNNFLHRFDDLIADYRTYDSKSVMLFPYLMADENPLAKQKRHVYKILKSIEKEKNLHNKLQLIVEGLVKYSDAKFARIWLVDKERKYLILKFSAGKYKNTHGEFSKVPVSSYKIGEVFGTKKPTITNDVANDPATLSR
jgi:DNA-binding Lrp family transcriptional regulator